MYTLFHIKPYMEHLEHTGMYLMWYKWVMEILLRLIKLMYP